MTEKKIIQFKLSPKNTVLLGAYCVIAGLLLWQSIRPFLAERHFRDGYYLEKKGYIKFSIMEQQKAVGYANWEPYYKLHLGKAYETHAKKSKKNKEEYYLKALEIYQKMSLQDTKSPWFKSRIAYVYQLLSQLNTPEKKHYTTEMKRYTKKAAEADPINPIFLLAYGQVLHYGGKLDSAIPYYKKIKEIDERILHASFNLADIYLKQNKVDGAIAEYKNIFSHLKKVQENPNLKESYKIDHFIRKTPKLLAKLYLNENKTSLALYYLEFLYYKSQYPIDINTVTLLCICYEKLGQYKKAHATYDYFLSQYPDYLPILMRKAELYRKEKKVKKAKALIQNYLKKKPTDKAAKTYLGTIK